MIENGNIFKMNAVNNETTSDLMRQLASLLAVPTRSDGKYYFADLFNAGSIPLGARFKPFRYDSENFNYDPNAPSAANAARATQRELANFGISMPVTEYGARIHEMARAVLDGTAAWTYERPRGRSYNEPFRLRDFDGFMANAKPPLYSNIDAFTTYATTSAFEIAPYFNIVPRGDQYQISLGELRSSVGQVVNFSGMYLGVCCVDPDSYNSSTNTFSRLYYSIMQQTYGEYLDNLQIDELGYVIEVVAPSTNYAQYNYKCFLFFSTQPTMGDNSIYPVPIATQTITVERRNEIARYVQAYANAYVLQDETRPLHYRGYIWNNTANDLNNIEYEIHGLRSNNWFDTSAVFLRGTISVPAGQVVYLPDADGTTYNDLQLIIDNTQYIKCQLNNVANIQSRNIQPVYRNVIPGDEPF